MRLEKKDIPVVLTISGLTIVGAFLLSKKITKVVQNVRAKRAAKNLQKGEQAAAAARGLVLSYPAGRYTMFAQSLESAMRGQGTDEDAIGEIMAQLKNDLDVLKTIEAFGTKRYYDWFDVFGSGTNLTLPQWLREELTSGEMEEYVNRPLRRNGCMYQF